MSTSKTFEETKRDAIVEALLRNNGVRTRSARELDISVRSLRNYIVKYGLQTVGRVR